MKTVAEWSNYYYFGEKISTVAELVREVREEALEEATKIAQHSVDRWRYETECAELWEAEKILSAIRKLKERP